MLADALRGRATALRAAATASSAPEFEPDPKIIEMMLETAADLEAEADNLISQEEPAARRPDQET
jgi:hypothetical protein